MVPSSGGAPARLIDWPTPDWGPDWSPDGKRVAFASGRRPAGQDAWRGWNLWILPVDGGEAVFLTEGEEPDWSPNGSQILYKRQGDLWIIPADGGKPTMLLERPEDDLSWARFSPDGSQILFSRSEMADGADIWTADVSGLLSKH